MDGASTRIFGWIDEKIYENRLDDVNFADLWLSIIHSARRISYRQSEQHDKLIHLVAAFKNHSIPRNGKYNYIYSSLTEFSLWCREAFNDRPDPNVGFVDSEADAWANVNFFFARITSRSISDCSIFAIWAMREALEMPQEDDKEATAAQKHDAIVPAAATWVFGMHRALFMREEDLTPKDVKDGNPGMPGKLWKGKAEFSKKRWWFCTSPQHMTSV